MSRLIEQKPMRTRYWPTLWYIARDSTFDPKPFTLTSP